MDDRIINHARLVLVDSVSYTASVLSEDLARRGFENVQAVHSTNDLPAILAQVKPDAVIFNYHSDQPDSLEACGTIKLIVPQTTIIAIVSPGPPLKLVRAWSQENRCIDVIIEKPLSDERFFMTLEDLLKLKLSLRDLQTRTERLANLLPEGAMAALENRFNNEAELFDSAVLFTDVRGSSQLIREIPPRDFFELLNQLLSAQSGQINRFQGAVVKYTGDGVMAIFRGMGRSYLALRCGLELARISSTQRLPFGVGVADGLVLAGLLGDSNRVGQRRQYDVIGATVHLASRLCAMAEPGEVVTTSNMNVVAKLATHNSRPIGNVSIRGFNSEFDCIALKPEQ